MKELETILHSGIKTEVQVKKKQEIEYVLEGTIEPKRGHKVWEINKITKEVKEASYKRTTAVFNHLAKKEAEKLIINKDCVYIPALNIKNAKKLFDKNPTQSFYYKKEAPMSLKDISF